MNRLAIVQVMKGLGVPASRIGHYKGCREVTVPCPLAFWKHAKKRDRTPSMSIRVSDRGLSPLQCFSCKFKRPRLMPLVEEVQHHDHTRDLTSLMARVAELEALDTDASLEDFDEFDYDEEDEEPLPESFSRSYLDDTPDFVRKLHGSVVLRGVTVETAQRWHLRYDTRRHRTIIPLLDKDEELQGVSGRRVDPQRMPKYLNYTWCRYDKEWVLYGAVPREREPDQIKPFPKSSFLLGEHLVFPGDVAVLVEGQFDCILLDQLLRTCGIDTLRPLSFQGNLLMGDQADRLISLVDEVVLFADNDEAGWISETKALRLLDRRIKVSTVAYPPGIDGKDPGWLCQHQPELVLELLTKARLLS